MDSSPGQAVLSEDLRYRYLLTRTLPDGIRNVLFIMLNPSTADALTDDPTIRKCMGFARRWHYGSLSVVNLFALRTPDPKFLKRQPRDVIYGPDNVEWVERAATAADLVIAAWGNDGAFRQQGGYVRSIMRLMKKPIYHLGLTKSGQPRHPLYLRYDVKPTLWVNPLD